MERTEALPPGESRTGSLFYFEIFAVSLAVILLEIAYTRIFSFKLYYYFTYLVLGIALMGLGAGAVLVAISRRLRELDPERLVPGACIAAGVAVLVGYWVIAPAPLNISRFGTAPAEILKLSRVCLVLAVPFVAAGALISTILGVAPPAKVNRLYGADLLGAGLGCAACIPLLELLDPPGCIALAGFIFVLGAAPQAVRSPGLLVAGGVAAAVSLAPLFAPRLLPDPTADTAKHLEGIRTAGGIQFSGWNPVFRVDVAERGPMLLLLHDGYMGSAIHRFDGDLSKHDGLEADSRSLPFALLGKGARVLVIGSAGGYEILASLYFGAERVTGVELNPVTVSLLTERYADHAGRLHEDPRVTIVNADGRSFLRSATDSYDLIWFVNPDSYAAMNASTSAAFVLSESYLYTVEMIRESLEHLAPGGLVCAQFGESAYQRMPYRTTRYLATAREAYADAGVEDFERRVLVASSAGLTPNLDLTTVVLGRDGFDRNRVDRFLARVRKIDGGVARYVTGRAPEGTVGDAIGLPREELAAWFDTQPYLVSPVRDDAPFFWHFVRFRDALKSPSARGGGPVEQQDAAGERIMLLLLGIAGVLAGVFVLLPFVVIRRTWSQIPYKASAGTYFAALGLGFMLLEVGLIQMLTLFLGYPTYSLSVTLFGLLVFSGLGSLASERFAAARNRALVVLVLVLTALVVFYQTGLPLLIETLIGAPLAVRVATTLVAIAPLGLCLGAFLPLGLQTVSSLGDHPREYVAWAWAINGFFSVIASTLATILAMTIGFRLLMLLALVVYALGAAALGRTPAPAAD